MTLRELPPGKTACRELGGEEVLLCHVDGAVYAVSALCTHEDFSLCLGRLDGRSIVCSLHGGAFDLGTGRPTADPAEVALKTYPVSIEAGDIYVTLETAASA